MRKGINIIELPANLRKGIERTPKTVPKRLIILGKTLHSMKGMSKRDASWILRRALKQVSRS